MRMGYAPGGGLRSWLTQLGYPLSVLQRAGLVHGAGYDRFESQERKRKEEALKQAVEARKQAVEARKQELHSWHVLLAEAEAEHRLLLDHQLKTPATSPTLSSLLPNW
jgi:hypothetical protein